MNRAGDTVQMYTRMWTAVVYYKQLLAQMEREHAAVVIQAVVIQATVRGHQVRL